MFTNFPIKICWKIFKLINSFIKKSKKMNSKNVVNTHVI